MTNELEVFILNQADEKLKEQSGVINFNIEQAVNLIDMVNEFTEIVQDDHNRAIFVFTVVTVIFLPMGFIAAYLSMNGGPSNPDWDNTQKLFWKIALPLAVGIGGFCLVVAWRGKETQRVRRWVASCVWWLVGRLVPYSLRRPKSETESDYGSASGSESVKIRR